MKKDLRLKLLARLLCRIRHCLLFLLLACEVWGFGFGFKGWLPPSCVGFTKGIQNFHGARPVNQLI